MASKTEEQKIEEAFKEHMPQKPIPPATKEKIEEVIKKEVAKQNPPAKKDGK